MCEAKPGPRCADTAGETQANAAAYREAFPEGPAVDALTASEVTFATTLSPEMAEAVARQNAVLEQSVTDLDVATGDSRIFTPADFGDDTVDEVEISRDEEGLWARGSVNPSFETLVPEGEDTDEWLNAHQAELDAFVQDTYDGELSPGGDDWQGTSVDFGEPVGATDTVGSVYGRLRDRAIPLHNALNGAYGVTPFTTAARQWFDAREEQVEMVHDTAVIAALWSETNPDDGDRPLEDTFDPSDLSPEADARFREDATRFTLENRELIAEAKLVAASQGRSFDDSDVGHNLVLSRNHHGAGFWDRGLGEVGDKLHKAASEYGELHLEPGDDGKLYAI